LVAFTATYYYQFLSRDKKAGPASMLPKTTTHSYKATICIRYNTDKYKNTKLSNASKKKALKRSTESW